MVLIILGVFAKPWKILDHFYFYYFKYIFTSKVCITSFPNLISSHFINGISDNLFNIL